MESERISTPISELPIGFGQTDRVYRCDPRCVGEDWTKYYEPLLLITTDKQKDETKKIKVKCYSL